MLQTLRERLTLALVALLPFHALMVTVLTRVIAGPDHAPLGMLALWKEGLLAVILGLALAEILLRGASRRAFDAFDALITALIVLSVTVTAATHGDWGLYLFGFRYDFVPLVAFLLLRGVGWSDDVLPRAYRVLLWSGGIVALYALVSAVLPAEFFRWLGYSDLHSLYVPGRPVAAFQMIGETGIRRVQGPMSGPNQLGIWLLLPIAVCIARLAAGRRFDIRLLGLLALFGAALFLSFSRAAWIAAFVIACAGFAPVLRTVSRKASAAMVTAFALLIVTAAALFPSVIVRLSSSRGHLQGPLEAVQYMIGQPFGRGMGMAGPASNRVSDACVLLRETDDPSWAADRPDLCVFLGDTQVQPVDRACACPFLPENWFLQIGVEMGWIGFLLYAVLILLLLSRLRPERALFLGFLGVCAAGMFLHAFEDAAVSYALWALAAAAPSIRSQRA